MTTINSVCIVCDSSLNRLTTSQKYVFNKVLEVFGNDIGRIITILFTFSNGYLPQALAAVNQDKTPFQDYFKFNNSALYA
jgi:hypothetical protein